MHNSNRHKTVLSTIRWSEHLALYSQEALDKCSADPLTRRKFSHPSVTYILQTDSRLRPGGASVQSILCFDQFEGGS
jgi:hypothetical protein